MPSPDPKSTGTPESVFCPHLARPPRDRSCCAWVSSEDQPAGLLMLQPWPAGRCAGGGHHRRAQIEKGLGKSPAQMPRQKGNSSLSSIFPPLRALQGEGPGIGAVHLSLAMSSASSRQGTHIHKISVTFVSVGRHCLPNLLC